MILHPICYITLKDDFYKYINWEVGELSDRYFRKNMIYCRKDRKDVIKLMIDNYIIPFNIKRYVVMRNLVREDRNYMLKQSIRGIISAISAEWYYLWGREEN